MSIAELFVLAVGLSMDAFAVSICKGLSLKKISFKHMAAAGVWFGGFQALMPANRLFSGEFFCRYGYKMCTLDCFCFIAFHRREYDKGIFWKGRRIGWKYDG